MKPPPEGKIKVLNGVQAHCPLCNEYVRFGVLTKDGFKCDWCYSGKKRRKKRTTQ